MQRRQLPDSPRNPFAEGRRGSDVSDGVDSRFGPQKHPYRQFNFKLAFCVFAGVMITYGIYSRTTAPQAEVSDYVKFDIKAAPPSNSDSSFQSQAEKVIPSNLTEDFTEDEEEDKDDEEAEKADEPDFAESEEEGMKEKESRDGVDENEVDKKPWTHAVKDHTEAKAVAEAKQQEDKRKDTKGNTKGVDEVKSDQKIENSPKKEANITRSQVNYNEMKNSDDKEKKDDKNSTKIAADKAKPGKDVEVADEKIHAEEKLLKSVKDEKGQGQEKPLSDAVKGDTEVKAVVEEKQQEDEQKDTKGNKQGVDEVKPDKKVEDSPEKGANNTKPQIDNKEMTNSADKENNDNKNSTKIAADKVKPKKDVEIASEEIHAEEKRIKSVKDEKGQGQEIPLSDAVKGDTEAKSVDEEKQQEDELKDTKDDKKGFEGVNPEKKVEDSLEKGANITTPKVDDKEMKNSDDKNSTKIAVDVIKPDNYIEVATDKTHAEEKFSKPLSQVERIAESMKDDEEETDDTEDEKKSTGKDAGKKMAITPEAPADDEAAKALKTFAAKGVKLDGKEEKNDEQSKRVNEAKTDKNVGRVVPGKVDETKTQADEKDEAKKSDGEANMADNRTSDKNAISKTEKKVSGKPKVTALNKKAAEMARRDVEKKSSLRGKKGAMAMKITTSLRAAGRLV